MVKAGHRLPRCGRVAGLAGLAQLAAMRILPGMASAAFARDAAIVASVSVASGTSGPGVATGQRVIGEGMVEAGAVKPNQGETAPLVIAVAAFAGAGSGRSELTVKAGVAGDIAADA